MIESRDITAFAARVFSSSRGYSDRKIMHPDREWFWVVLLFFVIFVSTLAVSVWKYQWLQTVPDQIEVVDGTQIPHYNATLVDDILTDFSARSALFTERLGGTVESETDLIEPETATSTESISDVVDNANGFIVNDTEQGIEREVTESEPDISIENEIEPLPSDATVTPVLD